MPLFLLRLLLKRMSIYTLGIDVGSTTSKCVILQDGGIILAKTLVACGTGSDGPALALAEVLEQSRLTTDQITASVSTGYGRHNVGMADWDMSELSCHAKGANFIFPGVCTVIDIGGQDIKVLGVENGVMTNFQMNDKCAAGTGRFLDVMARILSVDVSDMGELASKSTRTVQISSTCTVFAESEVISQLSKGEQPCDIAAGIHRSVASKAIGLAHRVGVREPVVMTGGVSQNGGVVAALEEGLGVQIATDALSQYAGALGAALFAYQKAEKKIQIKH